MPSVANLVRVKISGKLPTLQLNFSDFKYKSILRLIDVTIPIFDNSVVGSNAIVPSDYRLSPGLFDLPETEYNIDETDDEDSEDDQPTDDKSREVRTLSNFPSFVFAVNVITRTWRWGSESWSFHSKSLLYVHLYTNHKVWQARSRLDTFLSITSRCYSCSLSTI